MFRSLESILGQITVFAIWFTISTIAFPYLSTDICIADRQLVKHQPEVEEVISLLKKYGLDTRLSCEDWSSIRLKLGSTEGSVLAQTAPQGMIREDEQTFIPLIIRPRQIITFSKSYPFIKEKHLFKLTLIHEIGHILGIGHVDDDNHIMAPHINPELELETAVAQIKEMAYAWD